MNWGWDGVYNGHFTLTGLYLDWDMDFRYNQDAVIGIQSPVGKTEVIRPKVIVNNVTHEDLRKYFWRQK